MARTGYLKVILQHKTVNGDTTLKELHGWAVGGSMKFYVHLHLSMEMDFKLLAFIFLSKFCLSEKSPSSQKCKKEQ